MSRIKMLKEIKEEAESLATSIGNFLISFEEEDVNEEMFRRPFDRRVAADERMQF